MPEAAPATTVAGLSDDQLLAQTGTLAQLDRQLQVFVIDHLLEIEARALHLRRGFSSLFDYVKRGPGYSDGATYRRIGAMKLCAQVAGTRERLRDGSLTLDAAAQLQSAFDRRDRQRTRATRIAGRATSAGRATIAGPGPKAPIAAGPDGSGPTALATAAPPELDLSARKALVDEAAGKSSREVMQMLAGVDPGLTAPADRLRPLDAERWELKAVIDTECQLGLEQLKGLLSHVDPHMTIGQLVGRLVKEGLDRHDPARPARRPAGSRSTGVERTSAQKQEVHPAGDGPARNRSAIHAGLQQHSGAGAERTAGARAFGGAAARQARRLSSFGAEAAARWAEAEYVDQRAFRAAGRRQRFGGHLALLGPGGPGGSASGGLPARRRALLLRGPSHRTPLRVTASAGDRSPHPVRPRRRRGACQPQAPLCGPSPPTAPPLPRRTSVSAGAGRLIADACGMASTARIPGLLPVDSLDIKRVAEW